MWLCKSMCNRSERIQGDFEAEAMDTKPIKAKAGYCATL